MTYREFSLRMPSFFLSRRYNAFSPSPKVVYSTNPKRPVMGVSSVFMAYLYV
jgi:hypothetical protein